MYPHWLSPGVRFNDCIFSEPVRLTGWIPPRLPGLFAILACDTNWAPRSFQPLCFGELSNNSENPVGNSGYSWMLRGTNARNLLVSILPLPFSTSAQRAAVREELVSAYNPAFQGPSYGDGSTAAPRDLAFRIGELERRNQEQGEKILFLLGNIYKQFEPLPVPERRRIGFLPEPAPAIR